MTGKHRKFYITLTIALLVALNIWRWWPALETLPDNAGREPKEFGVEDFVVRVSPVDSLPPFHRNIFLPKKVATEKRPIRVAPAAMQAPPEKSAVELARDSAQAEFAQIRCVGVSVRNESTHPSAAKTSAALVR